MINLRMITFNLHFGIRNLKMTSTVPGSIYSHSGQNVSSPIILKHSQNTITIHFLEEENFLIFLGEYISIGMRTSSLLYSFLAGFFLPDQNIDKE